MATPGFSREALAQMRLSQLRELARRLGVGRYSGLLRDQLIAAIHLRSPAAPVSEPVFPSIASIPAALPLPHTPLPERKADSPIPPEPAPNFGTWVSLLPHDPQWASVSWFINPADRDRALAAGGSQLALRLTDVTDQPAGEARPHTLQEVLVDGSANQWLLPVPLGDREYRVDLGYRTSGGGWISLRVSPAVRMPADAERPTQYFTPFYLTPGSEPLDGQPPAAAPALHEQLYQQASAARRFLGLGSEGFHELGALAQESTGGHLSGAGLWASGREASGAGMAPRQRKFWLVADAELIVYGATDPAATLTVDDQTVPLSSDGTFHFHTAFPDGEQTYPIRALAADGAQKRSITLDFLRSTPHAKVNSKETAQPEWF